MTIPVVLCIDVEPDPRVVNRSTPEPWRGYELSQQYIADLRARATAVTGEPANFSWFLRMDPQVAESYGSASWVADRYADHLTSVREEGDEIGLHPHAWRWLPAEKTWTQDFGDERWVEHCVTHSAARSADRANRCGSVTAG